MYENTHLESKDIQKVMELCSDITIDRDIEDRILLGILEIYKDDSITSKYSEKEIQEQILDVINRELSHDN